MRSKLEHIPSLTGLRAIAIGAVLVGHVGGRNYGVHWFDVGYFGVSLFFGVSGFLITRMLMQERSDVGRIHLARFYARRAVRLWPALWTVLLATVVLTELGHLYVSMKAVVTSVLFVFDLDPDVRSQAIFHTWSLAVEEQFYLVWPLLLIALKRPRRWLVISVLAAPLVRLACFAVLPGQRPNLNFQLQSRYDILTAGCLLALSWDDARLRAWLRDHAALLAGLAVVLYSAAAVATVYLGAKFAVPVGFSVEAVCCVVLVAVAVAAHDTAVGRVLNGKALVYVGTMSYSLYLWQQMMLVTPFGIFRNWPIGLAASALLGWLSFRFIERPLGKIQKRLHPTMERPEQPQDARSAGAAAR